jgi:hypothetical protein
LYLGLLGRGDDVLQVRGQETPEQHR